MKNLESNHRPYQAQKTFSRERILVLAPHPDDEIFGCGATLHHFREAGSLIKTIIVTDGGAFIPNELTKQAYVQKRKHESSKAAELLGLPQPEFWNFSDRKLNSNRVELVLKILEKLRAFKPTLIFTPAETEIHPDHLELTFCLHQALQAYPDDLQLWYYEVGQTLSPNKLVDITSLEEQLTQFMRCFESQLSVQNYLDQLLGLKRFRSYTLPKDVRLAEAFVVKRKKEILQGDVQWEKIRAKTQTVPKTSRDTPLISVLVRTLNRASLAETLNCIQAQDYPNVEIVVVNASGSPELDLGSYCGNHPLRVVEPGRKLNRPQAANAALAEAKGEYFIFLDDDDTWDSNHLSQLLEYGQKNLDHIAVFSGVKGKLANPLFNFIYESHLDLVTLLELNCIALHCALFKAKPILQQCKFDNNLSLFEDWDFIIQVIQKGSFGFNGAYTAYYESSSSNIDKSDHLEHKVKVFEKHLSYLKPAILANYLNEQSKNRLQVAEYQNNYREALEKIAALEGKINHMEQSFSWRYTGVFRNIFDLLAPSK